MKISERSFRIADTAPWPERRGLIGFEVVPTDDGDTYPFNSLDTEEAVLFIPNDPLNGPGTDLAQRYPDENAQWSCVMRRTDLFPLPS